MECWEYRYNKKQSQEYFIESLCLLIWMKKIGMKPSCPSKKIVLCYTTILTHVNSLTKVFMSNWNKTQTFWQNAATFSSLKEPEAIKETPDKSSRPVVFCKKVLLKILKNSQKSTCARVSFLIKKTLTQVFFCEFTFFRTPFL